MTDQSIEEVLAEMDAQDAASSAGRKKSNKKKNNGSNGSSGLMGLVKKLVLTAVVAVGGLYGYQEGTMNDIDFTVTGTEIKQDKSCSSLNGAAEKCIVSDTDYLIHTNKGTFDNSTSILSGKDIEDVIELQKKFQKGATYTAEAYGFDQDLDGINIVDAERSNGTNTGDLANDFQGAIDNLKGALGELHDTAEGFNGEQKEQIKLDPNVLKGMIQQ